MATEIVKVQVPLSEPVKAGGRLNIPDAKVPVEVLIGSHAVWVNAYTGECIARFGLRGAEVHRPVANQHLGECLECTHGRMTEQHWHDWKEALQRHYGLDLTSLAPPAFVQVR